MKFFRYSLIAALCFSAGWLISAEVTDLSITDASNTARFPENQAPSTVNDGARALEGIIARWYEDTRGTIVAYGSANAIRITANRTISAYENGELFALEVTTTNTGATTFQVASLATKNILKFHNVALASGDLETGQRIIVAYSSSEDAFQLLTPVANAPFTDPLTTRGDLIYRDSSSTTRLGLGAVNRVLASDGVDVTWSITASGIGTHTVFVPAGAMKPTASNGAATLTSVETTAGRPDMIVLDFDATADEAAQFQIAMPKSWNLGTVTFQGYWTVASAVTTGVAVALQCVSVSNDDTIDVAYGTAVVVTDDALGTA